MDNKAGHRGHVVEHRGVDGDFSAVLDVEVHFHAHPGHVGGKNFILTHQGYCISFKDDFWCDGEFRFIWKPKQKLLGSQSK